MTLPPCPPWLAEFAQRVASNDLFLTFAADLCFFLLCCLCYTVGRWRKQRRLDHRGEGARQAAAARTEALISRRPSKSNELSATAKNYLLFLDTGRRLFLVLVAISWPVIISVWGADPLVQGEALRSIRRTLFDAPGACVPGFPTVSASSLARCVPRSRSGGLWKLYVPGEDDPRPRGYYARSASLEACQHQALLCGAPALAFGPDDREPPAARQGDFYESVRGECWLFGDMPRVPSNSSVLPGFSYCQGNLDYIPGVAQFTLTIVYGVVALIFACRLLGKLSSSQKSLLESSAIWLTELPRSDREDGAPFELTYEDFRRVALDLKDAVNARLQQRLADEGIEGPYDAEDKVVAVCVVPAKSRRKGMDCERKRLAGHAFLILHRQCYADALLTRRDPFCGLRCLSWLPSYVHWQDHSLFKFGVPPWSAVTLRCQRAPPASDIIWKNLHMKRHSTIIRRRVGELVLLLASLSLVAPASLARTMFDVVTALHEVNSEIAPSPLPLQFWEILGQAADNLPSYFLLLVNSVALPSLISLLNEAAKPHLRSRSELNQFFLNLFYLLSNSFLIPMLGIIATDQSCLAQALSWVKKLSSEDTRDAIKTIGDQSLQAPDNLLLKYVINAALVTSGSQLIQLGKGIARRLLCLHDEPWPFAWGYWYAWSMSVMAVCLVTGVMMPSLLLLALLFFSLTHWAHKLNLDGGTFDTRFDMDRDAETAIACWMLKVVAMFWAFMALFFNAQPVNGDGAITLPIVTISGGAGTTYVPVVNVSVPTSTFIPCCCFVAAIGVWSVSSKYSRGGAWELHAWRRLGSGGLAFAVCSFRMLALVLLASGVYFGPHIKVERVEVPLHIAASWVLGVLSLLVLTITVVVRWLVQRKARGTQLKDLAGSLKASEPLDLDALLLEEGMEGMDDLIARAALGRAESTSRQTSDYWSWHRSEPNRPNPQQP